MLDYKQYLTEDEIQRENENKNKEQYYILLKHLSESPEFSTINELIDFMDDSHPILISIINESNLGEKLVFCFSQPMDNHFFKKLICFINNLCLQPFDTRPLSCESVLQSIYDRLLSCEWTDFYPNLLEFLKNLVTDDPISAELICNSPLYSLISDNFQNPLFFPLIYEIAITLSDNPIIIPLISNEAVSSRVLVQHPELSPLLSISHSHSSFEGEEKINLSTLSYLIKVHDLDTISSIDISSIMEFVNREISSDNSAIIFDLCDFITTACSTDTSLCIDLIENGAVSLLSGLLPSIQREAAAKPLSALLMNAPKELLGKVISEHALSELLEIGENSDSESGTEAFRSIAYLGLSFDSFEPILQKQIKTAFEEIGGRDALEELCRRADDENRTFAMRCLKCCQPIFLNK